MSETASQTLARLTAFIQANAPTIDLSPGSVLNELILGLETQIQNQVYNDINAISQGNAISFALASLADTYSPIIDNIASNYNVTRTAGAYSVGNIKAYVTSNSATYTLPSGTSFNQPALGYTYQTTAPISITSLSYSSEVSGYSIIVPVTSTDIGLHTILTNGAPFELGTGSAIPGFVQASAYGSFSAGVNVETDRKLITRFRSGLATSNLLTAASINNYLTNKYPSFSGAYIADATSPVNNRCQNNLLNLKIPGAVDVYVKTNVNIPQVPVSLPGTYLGSTDFSANTWQVTLDNNVSGGSYLGFYRVVSVQDATSANLVNLPFNVTYSYDSLASNVITDAAQARYSPYQTATINIGYTGVTSPSGRQFLVTVLAPYQLRAIQETFLDNNNRIPAADYLVKGVVPCMVTMSLSLVANKTGPLVDTVALQRDLFNYVNSLGIGESIVVSQIVNLCHKYNVARVDLPIVLNGRILAPYNTTGAADQDIFIEGNDFLQIPDYEQYGVTQDNTAFFLNYFTDNGKPNINLSVK
jgi:hypothetical protein